MKLTQFIYYFLFSAVLYAQKQDSKEQIVALVLASDSLIYDQPQKSLNLAEQAYALAEPLESDSLIAISLNRVGASYSSLGDQLLALEKIQESLQISESNDFEALIAKNLGDIGKVYAACGLELDAIGYFRSELSTQRIKGDTSRLFAVNNNMGKAFLDLNYYDSARKYLRAASTFLHSKFEHQHSIYYLNQAELYFKEGESLMADSLIHLAKNNSEDFQRIPGIIRANQLRAEWHMLMEGDTQALKFAESAFDLAVKSDVKELIYLTSKTLSKCYGKLGRFEDAYDKQLLYEQYLNSVRSVSVINELELLSYYQRLFQMRVLESKNTVNKELADQRELIIQGLVVALLIAGILISIIFLVVRELGIRKRELEKLNTFRSKIFAIVSHDLKSPIQSVSSVIELFNEKLISKEEIEPVLPEVKEKTSNLMNLLNNVFLWAEGQMEGEMLKKETFELFVLVEELRSELHDRLIQKKINLEYDSAKGFEVYSDPGIIRIVLRNLIVNAIKFSNEDSIIEVNAVQSDKTKVIEVIDSGIGMTPEMKEDIFNGGLVSTEGTAGERGNGLGLALCYDFVKSLGGKIEVESKLGEGSVFRIILKDQSARK